MVVIPVKPRRLSDVLRDSWLLRSAFLVSTIGDWIYRFAVPTMILATTGSALATALAYTVELMPYIIVGLFSGVIADRFDRRRVLIVCDLTSAAIAVLLAWVVFAEHSPVWMLYALAVALASVRPFYFPAFQGMVIDVVPSAERSRVNAWTQTADSALGFLGPAVGTAVIATIGVPLATVANAASFVLSGGLVWQIVARRDSADPLPGGQGGIRRLKADFASGIKVLWMIAPVRWGTFLMAGANLAAFVIEPSLIYLLLRVEGQPPFAVGVVFASQGIGAVVGAVCAPILIDRVRTSRLLTRGMALSAMAMALPAVTPKFGVIAVAWAIEGVATSVIVVSWFTVRQRIVPERAIGRVVAAGRAIAYTAIPLGSIVGGLIVAGPQPERTLFGVACAIQVLVAVLTFASPVARIDAEPTSK
jgi:MFS family permease